MIFHFVFVALATVTGAQLHLAQLAKGTCSLANLVNTWQPNGAWEISMQYSISGKDEIIPISKDCEARIESALSYCWNNSSFACTRFGVSIQDHELAAPLSSRDVLTERSQPDTSHLSCSCESPGSSSTASSSTASSSTASSSTASSSTATSSSTASSSTASSSTASSSPATSSSTASSSTAPPSSTASSPAATPIVGNSPVANSSNPSICIIKLADLDSNHPQSCRCSNNTSLPWESDHCYVYS